MASEIDSFFSAGLEHYPAAKRAVEEFESRLKEILGAAMQGQLSSSCTRLGDSANLRATNHGGDGSRYYSLFGDMAGAKGDSTALTGWLETGLWWRPEFDPAMPLCAYACVGGLPWSGRLVAPPGFTGCVTKSARLAHLCLRVSKPEDLPNVLDDLLRHLDVACKAAQREQDGG
jgi:hypothetical protein